MISRREAAEQRAVFLRPEVDALLPTRPQRKRKLRALMQQALDLVTRNTSAHKSRSAPAREGQGSNGTRQPRH